MIIFTIILFMILVGVIIWLALHNRHLKIENNFLEDRIEYWKALASQFTEEPEETDPWKTS